jgi:hypothetical protein
VADDGPLERGSREEEPDAGEQFGLEPKLGAGNPVNGYDDRRSSGRLDRHVAVPTRILRVDELRAERREQPAERAPLEEMEGEAPQPANPREVVNRNGVDVLPCRPAQPRDERRRVGLHVREPRQRGEQRHERRLDAAPDALGIEWIRPNEEDPH